MQFEGVYYLKPLDNVVQGENVVSISEQEGNANNVIKPNVNEGTSDNIVETNDVA